MQVFLVVYGANIAYSKRIIPGFATLAICMIIIPLLCQVGGSTGFYSCCLVMFLGGIGSGSAQGTVYMMAAAFPPEYMAAVMFGNGLAGLGVIGLRGIAISIWPADGADGNAFKATLALYLFASILLAMCALAQACLSRNEFSQYCLSKTSGAAALQ